MNETEKILKEAINITSGARAVTYGDKRTNHENIAALWNGWLRARLKPGCELSGRDVAVLMGLMKAARMMLGSGTSDSYVDAAAYFAIAGELASAEALANEVVGIPGKIEELGDGYDYFRKIVSPPA